MVIDTNETQLKTVAQLRAFFNGTRAVEFQPIGEDSLRYEHIAAVLRRLGYRRLKRPDKGVVLRYLERTTGYSRQQLIRLVRRGLDGEVLADVALHGTLSGPATKHLMQRALAMFGDDRYERLATLSVAHLYNLRHEAGYQTRRRHWTKTRGHSVPIAVRKHLGYSHIP